MKKLGVHGNEIITGRKTIHFTTDQGKRLKISGCKYSYYGPYTTTYEGELKHHDSVLYIFMGYRASNTRTFHNVSNVYEDW